MYQSVMAQRQGTGSSGVGFAFTLVTVKEVLADKNICLVEDRQTGTQQQVGLDKRGMLPWPQVGDIWIIDRSLGHWALRSKVTGTSAPDYTGFSNLMDDDLYRLVQLLAEQGLLADKTTPDGVPPTPPAPPAFTASKSVLTPAFQSLVTLLDGAGVLDDQTTAAPVAMDTWQTVVFQNGFTGYTSSGDDVSVRYKRNYDNTVTVEGRATPPGSVTSGVTMFNIAANFRPPLVKYQTTIVANGVSGTIVYGKTGDVQLYDFGATTPVRVLFHMRYSLLA